MCKRLMCLFVILSLLFTPQGPIWATLADPPSAIQMQVITLPENPQLAAINADLELFPATGLLGQTIEPWNWVYSLVIPGLGQVVMGEPFRGALFFGGWLLLIGAWAGLTMLLSNNTLAQGLWSFSSLGLAFLLIVEWLWNVVDAVLINQAKLKSSAIESDFLRKLYLENKKSLPYNESPHSAGQQVGIFKIQLQEF